LVPSAQPNVGRREVAYPVETGQIGRGAAGVQPPAPSSTNPLLQVHPHTPPRTQAGVVLAGPFGQGVQLEVPQLAGKVLSTQISLHTCQPPAQLGMHTPPVQFFASPAGPGLGQTCAQLPQLLMSLVVFVSQPSSAVGAPGKVQLANPALHADVLHSASEQETAPETWLFEQARPHPPQFAVENSRKVSQPLVSAPEVSQFP
jgi:hypothetical protein